MGAWGIRTFENDTASDWIEEFAAEPDPARLREALSSKCLSAAESGAQTPGAGACTRALAAAEVVAAWRGRPAPELPPTVTAWLLGRTEAVSGDILDHARSAVEAVLEHSELRELWAESGDLEAWKGALEDLRLRLGE